MLLLESNQKRIELRLEFGDFGLGPEIVLFGHRHAVGVRRCVGLETGWLWDLADNRRRLTRRGGAQRPLSRLHGCVNVSRGQFEFLQNRPLRLPLRLKIVQELRGGVVAIGDRDDVVGRPELCQTVQCLVHDLLFADHLLEEELQDLAVRHFSNVLPEGGELVQKGVEKNAGVLRLRSSGDDVEDGGPLRLRHTDVHVRILHVRIEGANALQRPALHLGAFDGFNDRTVEIRPLLPPGGSFVEDDLSAGNKFRQGAELLRPTCDPQRLHADSDACRQQQEPPAPTQKDLVPLKFCRGLMNSVESTRGRAARQVEGLFHGDFGGDGSPGVRLLDKQSCHALPQWKRQSVQTPENGAR